MQSHQGNKKVRNGLRVISRKASIIAMGALVGVGAVGATPAAAAPVAVCATSSVPAAESSAQTAFVDKLNSLRTSKGLGSLVVNSRITGPAVSWSETMSSQNWLHHARDTGAGDGVEPSQDYVTLVTSVVPNWRRVGENVGVSGMTSWCSASELDASTAQAVRLLHDAFVKSSGHYANMVGDFNQVGIGVEIDADQLWVTVRFAKGDLPAIASSSQIVDAKEYINAVYELFLGRSATATEQNRWAPSIVEGRRSSLTGALAVSDEWAGSRIADFYTDILGRSADPEGRRSWVAAVAAGKRLEDVAAGFYGSSEYFSKQGGTRSAFVESLYSGILGRSADPSGRTYWERKLAAGMSRQAVAAGFYGSIESRLDRVENLYQLILGRGADPSGRATWTRKLTSTGDIVLASLLATSKEYWDRATR